MENRLYRMSIEGVGQRTQYKVADLALSYYISPVPVRWWQNCDKWGNQTLAAPIHSLDPNHKERRWDKFGD